MTDNTNNGNQDWTGNKESTHWIFSPPFLIVFSILACGFLGLLIWFAYP